MSPALRTEICEMLGIRYPIIQTGMGWVATPELVAAVSNAGGIGFLANGWRAGPTNVHASYDPVLISSTARTTVAVSRVCAKMMGVAPRIGTAARLTATRRADQ